MTKEYFLDGDDYYDKPDDEYRCGKKKIDDPNHVLILGDDGHRVYPCNVYDKDGKFLRIERPKKSEGVFKWKRWTSRY
mgnify:CR=1 FL=1